MKIYAGNLSFNTSDNELRDAFARFGEVESAQVITDRETGRSRGFGFVEMDDQGAQEAMQALNGQEHGGRSLTVNEAKPKNDRGGGNSRR